MSLTCCKDVFAFDPGWELPQSRPEVIEEAGIRQAVFAERVRGLLIRHTLKDTVNKLQTGPSALAEPTAYFVAQHLVRIYNHLLTQIPTDNPSSLPRSPHLQWLPDARGHLTPILRLELQGCQKYVRRTLVDQAMEDLGLLEKFVEQAIQETCIWFSKGLEEQLGLEHGLQLTDVEFSRAFHGFLKESQGAPDDPQIHLIHFCAKTLARGLVETLEPELRRSSWFEIEQMLGLQTQANALVKAPSSNHQLHEFLEVMNASHYHAVRDALASKRFTQTNGSPWPTAILNKGRAQGYAELRPAVMDVQHFLSPDEEKQWVERMWKQREELSDLDADALDALSAIWLRQTKNPDEDAVAGVDEILEMRGILPKKGGQGRRGGYHPEQRLEILRALSHIQNLWMNMTQMEVYEGPRKGRAKTMAIKSRAFTITDMMGQLRLDGHMDVSQFIFRPGKVFAHFLFGVGRQTALLSARALHYNPYRQASEKRLARYLSWQWRCQAGGGCLGKVYLVGTLLEVVGEVPNQRYPNRSRERLERLLDVLLQDKLIATWQYERWQEERATQRGWLNDWMDSTLLLEPPTEILEQYGNFRRSERPELQLTPAPDSASLGERMRVTRLKRRLSQVQLGEQLGLHQSAVNRLERGQRTGSKATRELVEAWIQASTSSV
ncbi:MAG: helix-turn-helix transcriptional regulator [Armatimonadetes bacterium]|nr:helix-turn-helix transcriptional regulator [Armatimonadota bacterium]